MTTSTDSQRRTGRHRNLPPTPPALGRFRKVADFAAWRVGQVVGLVAVGLIAGLAISATPTIPQMVAGGTLLAGLVALIAVVDCIHVVLMTVTRQKRWQDLSRRDKL